MTSPGFFRLVWRFNALAIAAAACLGIAVAVFALYEITKHITRPRQINAVDRVVTPPGTTEPRAALATFEPIPNTTLAWAPITETFDADLGYASKSGSSIRDYRVYDTATAATWLMLGAGNALVLDASPMPVDPLAQDRRPPALVLVRAVTRDHNGDGRLSERDRQDIVLLDTGVRSQKFVATSVDRMLGTTFASDEELVLFVETDGKPEALHIRIADRTVIRRTSLE